ncbi:MAG: endolytic transglycosylase MltG [Synergistaceae bacterium]|nr:endolytic transglycosylase MltG [Synergistaceae bacterium]
MKKRSLLILFLVLFLLGLGAGATAFFMKFPYEFWDRLLPPSHGELKVVIVRPGLNARQCALAFYEQGALTDSPAALARWMSRLGIDRKFRSGQYRVRKSGAWDMARQLLAVQPIASSLTVIPGMDVFSLREIFDDVKNPTSPKSGDLLRQALLDDRHYPQPMRELLPESEESRIAFLLPETYFVVEESPEELVQIASHTWWERYGERARSMTSKDLGKRAIVASIVQREALWDEERATIAGVVENRLKKNMLLQIDATVIYAWKLKGKNLNRVLYSDLELNSPYNTYVASGLPPAPICVPSAESWEAALEPGKNYYYYYVARKDGYHYFAPTYEEHRRNIKKARAE